MSSCPCMEWNIKPKGINEQTRWAIPTKLCRISLKIETNRKSLQYTIKWINKYWTLEITVMHS